MKQRMTISIMVVIASIFFAAGSFAAWGAGIRSLSPEKGLLLIPVADINDGKAHFFKVRADDGIIVTFFTLKSSDGTIRSAIDACDVCYRSGKGYSQAGDYMVCQNCGMKFRSDRINEVSGGCNPAPLPRKIEGDRLVIDMKDINGMSWYCKYKK
ncbi:MAG: DUF2318 domain-containing protein [Deltaproteobacteria bacterium]|nr:DUF2318 domain-containing protein [Deltaproteobacteria bacterium]